MSAGGGVEQRAQALAAGVLNGGIDLDLRLGRNLLGLHPLLPQDLLVVHVVLRLPGFAWR